jgi:hypothetical protein
MNICNIMTYVPVIFFIHFRTLHSEMKKNYDAIIVDFLISCQRSRT